MIKAAAAERHGVRGDLLAADVGQRIHRARLERGMTLAAVGGEDLSRSFLSLVEHGQSRISLRALAIVADRLGLPISYFLSGEAASPYALAELALDDAEVAIRSGNLGEAQRVLPEEVPADLRGRSLWLRGWLLSQQGRHREAIPLLAEAQELAEKAGDPGDQVRTSYTLAMALYGSSSYDEALENLRPAFSLAKNELGDRALMGRITAAIAHISYSQGHFDQALEQFARARELFDSVDDPLNLASVYSGLSRVYRERGEIDQAFRYSRLSLGIHQQRHNERAAAQELTSMAGRTRELGNLAEARQYAERAVELARRSRARDIEALAHSSLARTALEEGDLETAAVEALAAEEAAGDEVPLARTEAWLIQARIAALAEELARVDELFLRALQALEEGEHHHRYADAALQYSEILQGRGDTEGALQYALASARSRARRIG